MHWPTIETEQKNKIEFIINHRETAETCHDHKPCNQFQTFCATSQGGYDLAVFLWFIINSI